MTLRRKILMKDNKPQKFTNAIVGKTDMYLHKAVAELT
jgi:hypothetical protein